MSPEVSIGLTFYNNADTLLDALRSIFAQSFQDWELIIVDDNSNDGSFEIVQAVRDPRVRIYREKEKKGFVPALNLMTQISTGRYYARMDADDMMHPERLKKQVEFLRANERIDVVDTLMCSMDQKGRAIGVRDTGEIDFSPSTLLSGRFFHHATVLGKTSWFQNNPYDTGYIRAEDCELWCRTYKTSMFARIKEPLYFVREGLVNVKNHLQSRKTVRKIIRTYGPKYVGKRQTMQLLAESFLKGLAYQIFASVNSHDILVNMRNRKLNEEERTRADSIIEQIKHTKVPGL